MTNIRRSVLIASSERYVVYTILFLSAAILGRLLTPHEIGLSVIGTSAVTMAEALRDFGTGAYLVQKEKISRGDARTVFLAMLLIAVFFSGALALFADPIADFYGQRELVPYLHLIAIGIVIGPFFWPIMALLRREMAFVQLAAINIAWTVVGSVSTILLALLGFSYMSFAWAGIIGSCAAALLTIYMRPYFWMYVPSVSSWRAIFSFGRYSSISILAERCYEVSQYWLLGRMLSLEAVGLYSRAVMLAGLPDRVLFSGIGLVALPAFAAKARESHGLKQSYLRALGHTTVVQWPALILIAFLAHPLVRVILGDQWSSIAPIVQIIALARLLSFPQTLSFPLLVAVGQIRHVALANTMVLPINLAIFFCAAAFGLHVVAYSMFLTTSLQAYVALRFVRLSAPFEWRELAHAVKKSAIVSVVTAAGPASVVALMDFELDLSLTASLCAGLLAGLGWLVGIWMCQHPMLSEITHLASEARRRGLRSA